MSKRAPAMAPEERQALLIEVTIPLLYEKGRDVSTRDIASAAGVAEGTIFRVFDSKQDLVDQAVQAALSFDKLVARLRTIPDDLPLEQAVRELVTAFADRLRGVFALMDALGVVGPPPATGKPPVPDDVGPQVQRVLALHANELSVPAGRFAHMLRMVAFAGTHPRICHGDPLSVDEIVHLLLDGARRHDQLETAC